jgi:hypothetical protein
MGFCVYFFSDVAASVKIEGASIEEASMGFFKLILSAPQEFVFILLPFILIGLSVKNCKIKRRLYDQIIFAIIGFIIISIIYFTTYPDYYTGLLNKKWTASSFVKGFMALKGIGVAIVVMYLTGKLRSENKDESGKWPNEK